jgi:ATP-dependent DNA helicase RecG
LDEIIFPAPTSPFHCGDSSTQGEIQPVTGEATGDVAGEVERLVLAIKGEMRRADIQEVLGLCHEDDFRKANLAPALEKRYVEMTSPDKPKSSMQKYRLTKKGEALRLAIEKRKQS